MEITGWRQWASQRHIAKQSLRSGDASHPGDCPHHPHMPAPHPLGPPQARSAALPRTKAPGQKSLLGTTRGAGHGSASPRSSRRRAEPKSSSESWPRNPGHCWRKGNAATAVVCAGTWVAQALGGRVDFSLILAVVFPPAVWFRM